VVVQPPQVSFSRVDQSEVEESAVVSPGVRYRLSQVLWSGKYIFPEDTLSGLVALHGGDVFDTSKVSETLEKLRTFYSARGYINLTAVPNTEVSDSAQTVSLTIDIDAGRQFRLSAIELHGYVDDDQLIMKALNAYGVIPGKPYDGSALEKFFQQHTDLLGPSVSPKHNVHLVIDNNFGWVMLQILRSGV
jgi:outer membrane protein assembly factor BamA